MLPAGNVTRSCSTSGSAMVRIFLFAAYGPDRRIHIPTGTRDQRRSAPENALSICYDQEKKKNHNRYWQEHLFEMVDSNWQGEEYVFEYKPESPEIFDVGFNHLVGNKWPSKAWPLENWEKLDQLLKEDLSTSWQQGLNDMYKYFDWINGCRLIVTNDSFGLHLAIAMKKKVIVLFGPTNSKETFLYKRGEFIDGRDNQCPFKPCYLPICINDNNISCISMINPEVVSYKVRSLLNKKRDIY